VRTLGEGGAHNYTGGGGAHGREGGVHGCKGGMHGWEGARTDGEEDAHDREGGCPRVGMGAYTTVAFTNFRV
jgi:hypothetical protein